MVLMQVAVVGVDAVGVVTVVLVLTEVLVLAETDIYRWIAVPNSFTVVCSSFTWDSNMRSWM